MTVHVALCFPGQGSQRTGMHVPLVNNPRFEKLCAVAAAEGLNLPHLMEGSLETLTETVYAQPALYVVETTIGLGVVDALPTTWSVVGVAGHSVGEYAACATSDVLSPEDGLRLVMERGRAMGAMRDGGMASVLGLDVKTVERTIAGIPESSGPLAVAGRNAPGQVVISGAKQALSDAAPLLSAAGARRVVPLNVSGAFHSPLMHDASEEFARMLEQTNLRDAMFPVVQNWDAAPHTEAHAIRIGLEHQVEECVKWEESVQTLVGLGTEVFIECGPGTVLAGLIKRCVPGATVHSLQDLDSLDELVAAVEESVHA